jgi:predicted nucleic-acid-binding protein
MKRLIYFAILLIFGCSNYQTSDNNIDSADNLIEKKHASIPDSLYDPTNYYFLSFLPTKTFAEFVLSDSVYPNDYQMIYYCLDSLCSNDKATRDYYFTVLNKIFDNIEVVLHQQMGQYLINNIDKFKAEFLDRLTKMNDEQIKFYAQGIKGVLRERNDKGLIWLSDIKSISENANNKEQTEKLNLFLKEIEIYNQQTQFIIDKERP